MKTLVDLYPELFDVQASAFFENGKLSISPVVEATITQLDKKTKDYGVVCVKLVLYLSRACPVLVLYLWGYL